MGTRGIVAIKQAKGWKGIYNHFDSYPEGLGKDLLEHLSYLKSIKRLDIFKNNLLKCTTWQQYKNLGLCPYCNEFGSPCNIDLSICKLPVGDPLQKGHEHLEHKIYTDKDNIDWADWLYVVDLKCYKVYIFEISSKNEKTLYYTEQF